MIRLLLTILVTATVSHAGMLFMRVDSTDYGRAWDSALLDNAARDHLPQPQYKDGITSNNYAVTYTHDSGTVWACPGNGDHAITQAFVNLLISGYGFSADDVFYREQRDTHGLTHVHPPIDR